jgi:NAD(P)-dependent dehydrogenase (short-subunit alcohol dehydrogenase family)
VGLAAEAQAAVSPATGLHVYARAVLHCHDAGMASDRVMLITGASSGIGAATARAAAAAGWQLVLGARSMDRLEALATELGDGALPVQCDVTDWEQQQAMVSQALERFGRLDVLVNNAGAFDGGPLDELSLDAWNKVIAVNLTAPFLCTREALRVMKRQGGGRIINIGSISAQRVRPRSAPYSSSKHGLWGLTQVTALEGRDYGVTCGCLHPGNVRVERRAAGTAAQDTEPMMGVDDLARAAVLMATLPPHVNMLEAIVLPMGQLYVGRG